ncbi:MAG: hypothetical protein PVF51_05565 [Nitrospirota bacterium]
MKPATSLPGVTALLLAAAGAACTSPRPPYDAMYEALRARQCLEREGMAFCDDYFENSYRSYHQERERYLQRQREEAQGP